jgi:hypothetical protein
LRIVPGAAATTAATTATAAAETTANAREVNGGHLCYVSIEVAIIWEIPVVWVEAGVSGNCGVG